MRVERGRLSASLDANFAVLREICIDGEEIFRGIGFVVRDAHWGTLGLAADGAIKEDGDALVLRAQGRISVAAEDLDWQILWRLTASSVRGDARWSSRSGFTTNRTGFVVLHSLGASRGREVAVLHPGGAIERSRFPVHVAPHQPFVDIAGLTYATEAGTRVELRFEGELFETEDQRNWTDASYKTYCRPLRLPFPYRIAPDSTSRQAVELRVTPPVSVAAERRESPPVLGPPAPTPLFGTSVGPEPTSPQTAAALAALGLDFTAVELEPASPEFASLLDAALRTVPGPLRLDFRPAPPAARIAAVRHAVRSLAGRPCLGLTLWGADDAEIDAARALAGDLPIGAGSAAFFAELNRMRPLPTRADYLSFATTPTVHGDGDDTIGETTEPLEDLIATVEDGCQGRALHLGPLTLRARFNPNATTEAGRRRAPPDPRQSHPIAAAWMLGTIAGAHGGSTRSFALFEPVGPRGLVSDAGDPTPAARVLAWLRTARGQPLRKAGWIHAPRARGLMWEDGTLRTLCVSHGAAGMAVLPLPPGPWRVAETIGPEPGRIEGETLFVRGFCSIRLSQIREDSASA